MHHTVLYFCFGGYVGFKINMTATGSFHIYIFFSSLQNCRNTLLSVCCPLLAAVTFTHFNKDIITFESLSISLSLTIYTVQSTHTFFFKSDHQAVGGRALAASLSEKSPVLVGALSLPVGTSGSTHTDSQRWKHRKAVHSASLRSCCTAFT